MHAPIKRRTSDKPNSERISRRENYSSIETYRQL
jgi:hypothetical protein